MLEEVKNISSIQDRLFNCYSGADKELFTQIAPWCCRCDLLAIAPHNCAICQAAILCGTCHDEGHRICETCEESQPNDPDRQVSAPNAIASKILESAQFKCVYKCNPKLTFNGISALEQHLMNECSLLPVACT